MTADPKFDPSLITVVERLLTEAWAGQVCLGNAEMLQSEKCYRLVVTDAPAGAPASVIVKKAPAEPCVPLNPDATEANPSQPLLEEWAGLAFLNSVLPDTGETSLISKLYGGERAACIVVFEDLGKGTSLVDALNGTDPDYARECLKMHAHAVAHLHAHTLGQEAEERYWQIRDALGPRGVPRDGKRYGNLLDTQGWGDLRALQAELQKGFDRIGQHVPQAFWDEYASLVAAMENPSPFRAYVHNDSCPDNTFLAPGNKHLQLIDFERGGYHLCLLDAAYCRLSMPHCYWANRLPDDVAPRVESAYRKVLSQALPEAADDRRFALAMTEACAYWIISNGMWMVHRDFEKDFTWGSATWRQRVFLRLEQFAATTEEFSHLPAMGTAARETVRRLKSHWTCDPMPLYPAFL
jgi:Ser/Thr protein kinase RdoA (MazF antagonist)